MMNHSFRVDATHQSCSLFWIRF